MKGLQNLNITGSITLSGSANVPMQVGTNILYISASGQIGINNINPSYTLDVTGTGRFTGALLAGQGTFQNTGANIISKNTTTSQSNFIRYDNSAGSPRFYLGYETAGSDFYFDNSENGSSIFITNNTERMRITNGGNVGIGTSSPDSLLQIAGTAKVNGSLTAHSEIIIEGNGSYPTGGTGLRNDGTNFNIYYGSTACLFKNASNVQKMSLDVTGYLTVEGNGNGWTIGQASGVNRIDNNGSTFRCLSTSNSYTPIAASAFNVNSDYRLKEDLQEFNNSLNVIKSIKIYDFKWKDKDERNYGVIAHELQEVLPYVVYGEKDALEKDGSMQTQGVDYGKLVPVLIKAIQEQQAQIEELKAQINK
jgi:hypothetical protein